MRSSHAPVIVFLLTALLYALSRSPWLDEWDCVQFALALDDFDLGRHQPHPPGYPLFIAAGRLLYEGLGLSHVTALTLVAAAGGALFVAVWFALARSLFGTSFAGLFAATLAFTPVVWMTSTKALTDAPAAACLAWAAASAWRFFVRGGRRALLGTAVAGALAAGIRPQLFPVVLVLLLTVLLQARARFSHWLTACTALLVVCALWFLPTAWSQARRATPPDALAYPRQLWRQWQWRLDKPEVSMASAELKPAYFRHRLNQHVGGWFRNGLGLRTAGIRRGGLWFVLAGLVLYGVQSMRGREKLGPFWRLQLPWALALVLIVLFSLPEDTRYYLAVMPLLWLAILRGWWLLPRPWRAGAAACPLLMFMVSAPLAVAGRVEPPPPVQMIRYLENHHAPRERARVWLLCANSLRQARWYGTAFQISVARPYGIDRAGLASAVAVYTEDAHLALHGNLAGTRLEPVTVFTRSPLVYPKHDRVELYRVVQPDRAEEPVTLP